MASESALDADVPSTDDGMTGVPARPDRSKRKGFSMMPVDREDFENVRVPRPPGVPEWGVAPGGPEAPVKGQRKEDRWV